MKINIKHEEKVEKALRKAEGACSARTLCPKSIIDAVRDRTKRLRKAGVKVKNFTDIELVVTNGFGGNVPGSYRGTPMATHVWVDHYPSGWFVVGIDRCKAVTGKDSHGVCTAVCSMSQAAVGDLIDSAKCWV